MHRFAQRLPERLRTALRRAPGAELLRRDAYGMSTADVGAVLRLLERSEVSACVAGGFGVDALIGRPTRVHRDLDVVLLGDQDDLGRAVETLRSEGYEPAPDPPQPGWWTPQAVVLEHPEGMTVDLLPTTRERLAAVLGVDPLGLTESGSLDGLDVLCLSVEAQLRTHEGFGLRPEHTADLALLRAHRGTRGCG